jgi:hypothetical protein
MYVLSVFSSAKCCLFHNSNVFGSCIIHILYTGCAKIKKKNNSGAKRLIIFFRLTLAIFVYSSPQNVVYSLMLFFLVHKIFTFYINGLLNCKYPASGPKGINVVDLECKSYKCLRLIKWQHCAAYNHRFNIRLTIICDFCTDLQRQLFYIEAFF